MTRVSSVFHQPRLTTLKVLARYLAPYRRQLILAFLALTCAAVTILLMGVILRHLVDKGFSHQNPHLMNRAMILLTLCSFILAGAAFVRTFTTSWLSERVAADLRQDLFDHVLSFDQTYLESAKVGELMARLDTDMMLIRSVISVSAAVTLRSLIQLSGAIALLFITSPKLTGFAFVVIPLSLTPLIFMGRRVRTLTRQGQETQGALSAFAHEILLSLKSVQAFCQEKAVSQKYHTLTRDYLGNAHLRTRARSLTISLIIAIIFSSMALILWIGARDVFQGHMSFGDLSAFIFYTAVAAGSLNSLSEVGGEITAASSAMERILDIRNVIPIIQDKKSISSELMSAPFRIEFKNLTFSYPSRPKTPALENISFTIESGQTYAIVGPSGAGKSTLFQILQRFYDPQEGAVELNGRDIRTLPLKTLRKTIAIVPQDPYIFNASLWDNIAFSNPKASPDEIRKAAQLSYVEEFASYLPQGFDTILGERGIRLSGGQKQRLAIARAILYKAPFLLLDEATNALDAKSEYHVQSALDESFKNCTRLVIAHRLSTVLNADKILVLDQGKIVEQGTHTELLALGGLYAHLAEHQFVMSHQEENIKK
ncbi:MAG: ATP-binding cassette domain-containing protein [Caedimonas sp.]|nr:ATP-binding cassette domain-containing protein [Caedimonas sp.]